MRSDIHDVEVIYEHQTAKAVLVKRNRDDQEGVWLPKSMCEFEPSDPTKGDIITLSAKETFLIEKGLADN